MTLKSAGPEPARIVRSLLWQGGGAFVAQVVSWVVTIFVIRVLTPADYGLMTMATIPVGFLVLLCDLGVGTAAVQARAIDHDQLRRLAGLTVTAGVSAAILLVLTAPLAAEFFGEPRLTRVLRVLSIAFLLNASHAIPQALLMRELNFRVKATVEVTAAVASALVALSAALTGLGVWALVAGALAVHVVKAAAFNVIRPMALWPSVGWASLAREGLLRVGVLVTVDRILYFLLGTADLAVAGRVLGDARLGIYTIAVTISTLPLEKVLPPVAQVSLAALARMQAEPDRLRRNVVRGTRLLSLLLSPAFLGLAALAPDFVPLVLGPKWQPAITPLQLLCLVLPLRAVAGLFQPALFAVGRPGVSVVNTAVTLGILVVAFVIGVQRGVSGVALAWVAAYPVAFVFVATRATRALSLTMRDLLVAAAPPLLASALMALGVAALRVLLSGAALGGSAVGLGALIAAGAALYFAILWVIDREAVQELWRMRRG